MSNSSPWQKEFDYFRKKVTTAQLEGFWGNPQSDLSRIEKEIGKRDVRWDGFLRCPQTLHT